MTTPTLDELAWKHEEHFDNCSEATYSFTLDQLRALITEAVGIVAGEPVSYAHPNPSITDSNRYLMVELEIPSDAQYPQLWQPLHALDMGRLG